MLGITWINTPGERQRLQRKLRSIPLPFRSQDAGRRPDPMNGICAVRRLFSKSVSDALSVSATGQATPRLFATAHASSQRFSSCKRIHVMRRSKQIQSGQDG